MVKYSLCPCRSKSLVTAAALKVCVSLAFTVTT